MLSPELDHGIVGGVRIRIKDEVVRISAGSCEIVHIVGGSDCIKFGFVEREATSESEMKLDIRLNLAGLSLSDTVLILDKLDIIGVTQPSIIGYRRPTHSRWTVQTRITLCLTKP